MMAVDEVHTHFTPGGRTNRVNSRRMADKEAPQRGDGGCGGNNFPPALSSERAVMVKNAGHPYKIKKEGAK